MVRKVEEPRGVARLRSTSLHDVWNHPGPLPVDGAQTVAPVRVVSAGICSATGGTRLPVVVVSAPTPFAPFVALRPVRRLSGLVEVLFGVVLDGTPAVVPASVGVPFAAVVEPVALVSPEAL